MKALCGMLCASLAVLCSVSTPVLGDGPDVAAGAPLRARPQEEMLRSMGLSAGQLVPVAVASAVPGSPSLTIGLELGTQAAPRMAVFDVDPYPLRAPGFRVMASGADGELREVSAPAPSSFHGRDRATGDELWASVIDGKVRGVVYAAGASEPSVYIQPLADWPAAVGEPGQHVVYSPHDVLPTGAECGLDHCPGCLLPNAASGLGVRGPGCKYVELIAEADYPFYQANLNAVGATVQDIETIMLGVNAIYRNQAGWSAPVRFALKQVTVWTTYAADPYSAYPLLEASSSDMLVTEANRWAGIASPARDIIHLFTGRDLDSTTVGLAYTPGMCSVGFNASLVQSRFSTVLAARYQDSAHELGHNFGMVHDAAPGYIMNPSIDSSNPASTFSPTSVAAYNSYIGGFSCLTNSYPDVLPDGATTLPNTPVTIDVLANDGQGVICTAAISGFTLPTSTTALGGSATVSVGTGPGGRNQVLYTPPAGASGIDDSFQYTAGGVTTTVSVTVIAPRAPDSPPYAVMSGLSATYYNLTINGGTQVGVSATMPNFTLWPISGTGISSQLNYPPTTGAAVGSGRNFGVGADFAGYIQVPTMGYYQFWLVSDDLSRLFVGNQLVVDNLSVQTTGEATGIIALAPGRHHINVDYTQYAGNSTLVLSWAVPGQARVTMPASAFWHAAGMCHADYNGTGGVAVQDIFDFLNDWFAGVPRADFNGVDGLTVQDIFDFLNVWFGPC
jgi:hypothetical protein